MTKRTTQKKIIQQSEKLQSSIEKGLDRRLPIVRKDYLSLNDEISNIYIKALEINPTDTLNNRELLQRLNEFKVKFDDIDREALLYLTYMIFKLGNNKRMVTLFLELSTLVFELGDNLLKEMNAYFTHVVGEVYRADLLNQNIPQPKILDVEELLKYRIDGVRYSDRVWNNTRMLNDKIFDILYGGITNNQSYDNISHLVVERLHVGFSAANRLVKTELNAVYNLTLISYYKEAGVTQVRQISTLDMRTSKICRERHLNIIDIATAVVGENIPPLHPYCRSIIIPIINKPTGVKR